MGTLTSGTSPTLRTVGSVGGSDIQDYHRFNLTTAGNLRFALSNMSSDLDVELLDQFGQVITFWDTKWQYDRTRAHSDIDGWHLLHPSLPANKWRPGIELQP